MKFTFTSLGAIEHAEIELGRLTLICGENNTGKTYVTYGTYGFLYFWHNIFDFPVPEGLSRELEATGTFSLDLESYVRAPSAVLEGACSAFHGWLPQVFAAPANRFLDTRVEVDAAASPTIFDDEIERVFSVGNSQVVLGKPRGSFELVVSLVAEETRPRHLPRLPVQKQVGEVLKDILFREAFPRPFIISAERTGAAIFRNEVSRPVVGAPGQAGNGAAYPLPVRDNIEFSRRRESVLNEESFVWKAHPDVLRDLQEILQGEFHVDDLGILRFTPAGGKVHLTMSQSSSSVRALVNLRLYLGCIAAKDDLLIIDEPELDLHPRNQRRLARLLSRLVHLGLRVLVTTHSDYLLKELNLLMLMHSDDPHIQAVAEREKYLREESLDPRDVKLYVTRTDPPADGTPRMPPGPTNLVSVPIEAGIGMEVDSINRTIDEMNRVEDELLYGG